MSGRRSDTGDHTALRECSPEVHAVQQHLPVAMDRQQRLLPPRLGSAPVVAVVNSLLVSSQFTCWPSVHAWALVLACSTTPTRMPVNFSPSAAVTVGMTRISPILTAVPAVTRRSAP